MDGPASRLWARLFRGSGARQERGPRVRGRPPSANGASSFHLLWEIPTRDELVEAAVTLVVLQVPDVARLYFWALQVSFPDGGAAHLGLQWAADPPRQLRHVNWGGYGPDGSELAGATSELASSFDNPNTRNFVWEPGRPYRLRISREPEGWAGWVDGTLVRTLDAAGDTLGRPMVWSEVFADCDHAMVGVRWSQLEVVTRRGLHLPVRSAVARYQSREDGGCDNTSSIVDGDAFLQTTDSVRQTSPGTRLSLP
jgi:hypothetical protein